MNVKLLVAALAASASFAANAYYRQAPAPSALWKCNLSAQVAGVDAAFIIRGVDLWGHGTVACRSLKGDVYQKNVVINMRGFGIGPQIAFPTGKKSCFRIGNGNIGITDPRAMFSQFRATADFNYQVGNRQGALGAGAQLTVRNGGGASGQIQIKQTCGTSVGLGVGFNVTGMEVMTLKEANRERYYRGLPPMPGRPVVRPAPAPEAEQRGRPTPPPAAPPAEAKPREEQRGRPNFTPPPPPPAKEEGNGPKVPAYDLESPAPASAR